MIFAINSLCQKIVFFPCWSRPHNSHILDGIWLAMTVSGPLLLAISWSILDQFWLSQHYQRWKEMCYIVFIAFRSDQMPSHQNQVIYSASQIKSLKNSSAKVNQSVKFSLSQSNLIKTTHFLGLF